MFVIGSTSITGVNSETFDSDYQAAFVSSIVASLNSGKNGEVSVFITGISDDGDFRRLLLSRDKVFVSYNLFITMERYGTDVVAAFNAVDNILREASNSSSLMTSMKAALIDIKGNVVPDFSVSSFNNNADAIVVSLIRTPLPSYHPSPFPTGGFGKSDTSDDGRDDLFIIITVVVIFVSLLLIFGPVYNAVTSKKMSIVPDLAFGKPDVDSDSAVEQESENLDPSNDSSLTRMHIVAVLPQEPQEEHHL